MRDARECERLRERVATLEATLREVRERVIRIHYATEEGETVQIIDSTLGEASAQTTALQTPKETPPPPYMTRLCAHGLRWPACVACRPAAPPSYVCEWPGCSEPATQAWRGAHWCNRHDEEARS